MLRDSLRSRGPGFQRRATVLDPTTQLLYWDWPASVIHKKCLVVSAWAEKQVNGVHSTQERLFMAIGV